MTNPNARKRSWQTREGYSVFPNQDTCPFPCLPRKLREQRAAIELGLQEVFSAPVSAAVPEAPAAAAPPERTAAIVLGVLLATTSIAFLAYVLLDLKRKRYPGFAFTISSTFTADGFNEVSTRKFV